MFDSHYRRRALEIWSQPDQERNPKHSPNPGISFHRFVVRSVHRLCSWVLPSR
ncbi:hypothetical protein [Melghirimyces algeriensis]|uniref:Uncharacterized protein n=1 Tax=Melghirimyces algeriensis TaxID=910412 RepID=A0A521BR41_9BACL|nr:hypothetical protein [Melghirimyces algeriensis]SMO49632.1 hypothetical protein SAMN06264849_102331 [Melghirimyces algeriensis]